LADGPCEVDAFEEDASEINKFEIRTVEKSLIFNNRMETQYTTPEIWKRSRPRLFILVSDFLMV
jgi:hypothetical protein